MIVSKWLVIFDFDFGSKTIVYSFLDSFSKKNVKLIAFPIVCDNGVYFGNSDCLVSTKMLTGFRKPAKSVMSSDME